MVETNVEVAVFSIFKSPLKMLSVENRYRYTLKLTAN
jgi:hypothetical protein